MGKKKDRLRVASIAINETMARDPVMLARVDLLLRDFHYKQPTGFTASQFALALKAIGYGIVPIPATPMTYTAQVPYVPADTVTTRRPPVDRHGAMAAPLSKPDVVVAPIDGKRERVKHRPAAVAKTKKPTSRAGYG